MSGAALFTRLQDADFYRGFHTTAADLMGKGNGRSWLDVGTGPGLLARLAAERGYRAAGIDRSQAMIAAAKCIAANRQAQVSFTVSDIATELASGRRYDVVSAASLLAVTVDPSETLRQLKSLLAPGGRLLVIEASQQMSKWRALNMLLARRLGGRGVMLLMWAMARSGHAIDPRLFDGTAYPPSRHKMLCGMVDAWIMDAGP